MACPVNDSSVKRSLAGYNSAKPLISRNRNTLSAKLAVIEAVRNAGITKSELARRNRQGRERSPPPSILSTRPSLAP
jgi:hypothetical protein